MRSKKNRDLNKVSTAWNVLFTIVLGICAVIAVAPIVLIIVISFSSSKSIDAIGYSYIPLEWSLEGYRYVSKVGTQLINSYIVTIANSVLGTVLVLLLTSMYAFVLCQKKFWLKQGLMWFAYFTTLFGAGLVPTYMMNVKYYGLKDTFLILLLHGLVNPGWIIMLRAFINTSVPEALFDSARIDGAGYGTVYFRIVLPLLKAGLATIGLFSFVGRWNDWYTGLLYITNAKLMPLQTMLTKMQNDIDYLRQNSKLMATPEGQRMLQELPSDNLRMACTIVAIVPILFAYPFFQKYFVKGLVVGSVKG